MVKPMKNIVLCLAVGVPALALFLILSFYNHPVGDDFWCTAMVRKYGYWEAQRRLYSIVPPRYFELAISCLSPLSFGDFWGYKLIPPVYMLLLLLCMAGLFKALGVGSRRLALLPALLFVALYLCVIPGIAEGIYWSSSLFVYHTGLLLFVAWCTYLLKWYHERRVSYLVVVCFCLAGMLGCNELISIIALAALVVIVLARKMRVDGSLLAQLGVVVVCVGFMLAFRGTMNRYSLVRTQHSGLLFHSFGGALLTDAYYIGRVLINPFFWALALPGYGVVRKLMPGSPWLLRYRLHFVVLWVFVLVVIPFCLVFITGETPPPLRISNMIVFFFLFGLIVLAGMPVKPERLVGLPEGVLVPAVILLVVAGLLLPNNVSHGARDLYSGRASVFDKRWDQRIELIRQCKGDSCVVPSLGEVPFVFSFESDTDEPHISEYFEKEVLVR
jgi:hypothetical protein